MRVPGSFGSSRGENHLLGSASLVALLLFCLSAANAAYGKGVPTEANLPGEQGAMYLPPALLNRLPADMTRLAAVARPKKIEAKYDVSKIGIRDIGSGLDFYSTEKEIAMGRELSRELESRVRLVTDPVVTEYINRLGQKLVRNSDAKVPFTIKVVDDDEINAYALPGGFFYVNTGLILAADNEAELAGVMSHEIAHVAARHATKNETKSDLLNFASIPLMFFGGPAVMLMRQAMQIAVPMTFLKFNRDAEREADLLGLEYEYASGYDPEEFVKLFEKLKVTEKEKKGLLAKAFSTHPMTGDRIKRAQKEIEEYLPDRGQYVIDTSEFQAVRQRVAELTDRRSIDLGKVTPVLHKRQSEPPAHKPMTDATDWQKK